jgi:hypothetical protein
VGRVGARACREGGLEVREGPDKWVPLVTGEKEIKEK